MNTNNSMNIRKPLPHELPSIGKLVFSAILVLLLGCALLIAVVLPAEKGIDPTGIGEKLNLTRMGILKTEFGKPDAPAEGRPQREDELSITILPITGREIKMEMKKGFEVDYSWAVDDGEVYHDTHGDIYGNEDIYITYSKADAASADEGSFKAVFAGHHGWYWRNKGTKPVTITLRTSGQYLSIEPK